MNDAPVEMKIVITVPLWQSEVETFTDDVQYELGALFAGEQSFNRDASIEIEIDAACATDRSAELEAEVEGWKDACQNLTHDYLAAVEMADDWHRQYAEERERRIQAEDALKQAEGKTILFNKGTGAWTCPLCGRSTLSIALHDSDCPFALVAALRAALSSSAAPDGGGEEA
jgi:rubrerythrin